MCYSAQVKADYRKYVTLFGATMSIREFYDVFYRRGFDAKIKIPKAVEESFAHPQTDGEREIRLTFDEKETESLSQLHNLPMWTAAGERLPLASVAEFRSLPSAQRIERELDAFDPGGLDGGQQFLRAGWLQRPAANR